MEAGEAGVDYLMFGGLYPDGVAPDPETVSGACHLVGRDLRDAVHRRRGACRTRSARSAATGAEFVGLESGLWLQDPGAVERAHRTVQEAAA